MGFLFIAKRIWFFVVDNWRLILPVAVAATILFWLLIHYGCSKPAPKLNQAEITAAQNAIAVGDRKTMIEVLSNSDVREKQIDGNVSNAKAETVNATANSKAEWSQKSNDEIAAEIERRVKESQQ